MAEHSTFNCSLQLTQCKQMNLPRGRFLLKYSKGYEVGTNCLWLALFKANVHKKISQQSTSHRSLKDLCLYEWVSKKQQEGLTSFLSGQVSIPQQKSSSMSQVAVLQKQLKSPVSCSSHIQLYQINCQMPDKHSSLHCLSLGKQALGKVITWHVSCYNYSFE